MNCMCRLPHPPPLSSHIWKHPWHSLALVSTPPLYFLIALDSGSLCRPNLVTPWRLADSREVLAICQLPLQSIIYLEIKKSRSITEIWKVPCCAPHFSPATGHLYLLTTHNPSSSCPHTHPCLLQGTSASSLTSCLSKLSLTFPFPSPPCPSLPTQPCPAQPYPSFLFSGCPGPCEFSLLYALPVSESHLCFQIRLALST